MNTFSATKGALALALCISGFAVAPAHATVIGTEDPVSGFVGELFSGYDGAPFPDSTGWTVASDGESPFMPFNITVDVSDAVSLDNGNGWYQAADSLWTSAGNYVWYIPASSPGGPGCGSENEPLCEYVGHFISAIAWAPTAIGTWTILDANGAVGDVIITYNDANGANLIFKSDPIPEPASLALLGIGLAGLAASRRRKQA